MQQVQFFSSRQKPQGLELRYMMNNIIWTFTNIFQILVSWLILATLSETSKLREQTFGVQYLQVNFKLRPKILNLHHVLFELAQSYSGKPKNLVINHAWLGSQVFSLKYPLIDLQTNTLYSNCCPMLSIVLVMRSLDFTYTYYLYKKK